MKEKKSHLKENIKLRKEIEILKFIAEKITFSFQSIIKSQNFIFHKAEISLNSLRKQKMIKNIFSKASFENNSIKYFKYNQSGHKISKCNINRIGHTLVKQIWVSKKIICSNFYGPKIVWIPKVRK